jgi:hypothetical protein
MSLAAKLPFRHRYAAGFPGLGSQAVPTDADALDYLDRMAAADGASVEVGVATAVDAFVRDSKSLGVWDSIRASCILAGARTLAGALVPLRDYGPELWDAPTPTIVTGGGTSPGSWDAASQTMSCTLGTTANTPRFQFNLGLVAGSQYVVSGRLTGDTASVTTARLCIAVCGAPATISYNPSTGLLSGTVTAGGTSPPALEFGLDATLGPASVTIESLSIREVIASPTNVANGFVSGDYSRTSGLTGDGTSYIDSGRANDADPQNDKHISIYLTGSLDIASFPIGDSTNTGRSDIYFSTSDTTIRINGSGGLAVRPNPTSGLVAGTRSASDSFDTIVSGTAANQAGISEAPSSNNIAVFARNNSGTVDGFTTSTLAFYSIGTSLSLEDLDTAVSNLITRLKFALLVGENPSGLDPDTIDYIVRGYEAGGTLE